MAEKNDKKCQHIPKVCAHGPNRKYLEEMDHMDELDDEFIREIYDHGISSLTGMSDPARKCPSHWHAAMKRAEKPLWINSLYDHLEKCYINGTYSIPNIPPPGARVIPPVRALKHLHNVVKQIDERKVRVCVNGSKQIQGLDYQESYAAALLKITLNLFIAICCWFQMYIYHLNISNCFQCTPDESPDKLWVGPIFPEWIDMLRERLPKQFEVFAGIFGKDPGKWPKNLTVEMFSHVQARKDASKVWDEMSRKILKSIGIVPTIADPSLF